MISSKYTQTIQQFYELPETANSKRLKTINWPSKLTRLILMRNKPLPLGEQYSKHTFFSLLKINAYAFIQ